MENIFIAVSLPNSSIQKEEGFLSKGHRLPVSKGGSDDESFQNALYIVIVHTPPPLESFCQGIFLN